MLARADATVANDEPSAAFAHIHAEAVQCARPTTRARARRARPTDPPPVRRHRRLSLHADTAVDAALKRLVRRCPPPRIHIRADGRVESCPAPRHRPRAPSLTSPRLHCPVLEHSSARDTASCATSRSSHFWRRYPPLSTSPAPLPHRHTPRWFPH